MTHPSVILIPLHHFPVIMTETGIDRRLRWYGRVSWCNQNIAFLGSPLSAIPLLPWLLVKSLHCPFLIKIPPPFPLPKRRLCGWWRKHFGEAKLSHARSGNAHGVWCNHNNMPHKIFRYFNTALAVLLSRCSPGILLPLLVEHCRGAESCHQSDAAVSHTCRELFQLCCLPKIQWKLQPLWLDLTLKYYQVEAFSNEVAGGKRKGGIWDDREKGEVGETVWEISHWGVRFLPPSL